MKKIIEDGYSYLCEDRLINAAMVCLRIARKLNDYWNIGYFLRETTSDIETFNDIFFSETSSLKEDSSKYLFEKTRDRWIKERTLPDGNEHSKNPMVYPKSVGELEANLRTFESAINDYQTPQGMTPFDTAYFEDSNAQIRGTLRKNIRELSTIKERIRARCYNYLITIEKQYEAQQKQSSHDLNLIHEVNNYFKSNNTDIHNKLIKICELAESNEQESWSLLLTEIRRAISSVADFYYPPQNDEVKCCDGANRMLGKEQYLNRIQEYIRKFIKKSTSRELLLLEFDNLDKIIRKLNELSSKGVHDTVTKRESRQCLYSFYAFCSNLVCAIELKET